MDSGGIPARTRDSEREGDASVLKETWTCSGFRKIQAELLLNSIGGLLGDSTGPWQAFKFPGRCPGHDPTYR